MKRRPDEDDRSRAIIGVLLLAMGVSLIAPGRAQASPVPAPESALQVRPTVDLPLTLGSGALFLTLFLTPHRQGVLADQTVAAPKGLDLLGVQRLDASMASVSDGILFGGIAAGLVLVAYDGAKHGRFGTRTLLYLEAMMLVGAITEMSKWAVRRPRPYTLDERLGVPDDDLSFFSGHTSATAGWAFAAVRILDLTHRWPGWLRGLAYGGATLLTAGMATMRVLAGKHWPTDVLVGGLLGASVGWLVPELHRREIPVQLAVAPTRDGARLVLGGSF